jgi:uncharacterized protein (DUF2236 family)
VSSFREELERMSRSVDPIAGFFGPGSEAWKINREGVLYFGGMRALLMQIAHPKVAQGVADHSNFEADPLGRALRTFSTVYEIVYGDRETALKASARVHAIHTRVRGDGYHALDPELLFWVLATLIDSAKFAYELYLEPLPIERWEQFYADCRLGAQLFGIHDLSMMPPSFAAFEEKLAGLVASDTITVSETAMRLAQSLLNRGPLNTRATKPILYVLAAGTLPEKLRLQFGLAWNLPVRATFQAGTQAVRLAAHVLPRPLRSTPVALKADLRCWIGARLSSLAMRARTRSGRPASDRAA